MLWSTHLGASWVIHGTHKDKQECINQYAQEFGNHPVTDRERADGNMRVRDYVFHCLPDTVDPRGAKSK